MKFDGIVRGGVVFVIVKELGLFICFIGVGEKIEDLCLFFSYEFVEVFLSG